jgi:hypothetical protein
MEMVHFQGDKIGRIFAQWVFVCFGQLHENCRSSPHFWDTLHIQRLSLCIIRDKKGWATFWAKFLQTHLVTLSILD